MLRIVFFVTLCLFPLSWCARSTAADFPSEARAIKRIKATGAEVQANRDRPDGHVVAVTLRGAKDDVFSQLARFERLRQLSILDSPCLRGLGLQHLRALEHLQILVIDNAGVIDEGAFPSVPT